MIYLTFDMKDPRVVYDSPNVVFREGRGVLLEFGDVGYTQLSPGQPGYEAPPKAKARRRSHSPADNPTPTTMTPDNHFHFNVIPKAGGVGNTTRVVNQEELLTPELVASTKTRLAARGVTLTDEQITAVGEESAKVRIAALAQGRPVRRAFGFFTDDFTPTVQRDGVKGEKVPMLSRVYDGATKLLDRVTLGGPFRISGPEDFGPEPDGPAITLGIFLHRTGGTPVRIGMFSKWTDSEIFGSWPAAISGTGDVELRIVTLYPGNADPSVFIYGTMLPVVP